MIVEPPLRRYLERQLLILHGRVGELNLQIHMNCGRGQRRLGQFRAHADQREPCAVRNLQHVKVAVAVAGIERLHGARRSENRTARRDTRPPRGV